MEEFNDGTFGDIRETDEAFFEGLPSLADRLRAVHFAPNVSELEARKEKIEQGRAMDERVSDLEGRMEALDGPPGLIHRPTKKEQMRILRAESVHRPPLR